jgi:drug/metabolite transporter (DMT)-like permease
MSEAGGHGKAALAALTGGALIGFAPIAIRLSEVGPHATNFWRFVFALPILGLWAALDRPKPTPGQTAILLGAGALFGFEISLWAAALGLTTVTNATLLVNLTPVFAAVVGWLFLRERLTAATCAGVAMALAGAVTLALARSQSGAGAALYRETGLAGDAIALCGAAVYAGYFIVLRAVGRSVRVGAVMFWATLSAAAISFVLALALREPMLPHSVGGWALLAALGVIVQVLGQGLIAYGVGRLPIVISTVLLWMQPLVAAALSWVLFGEALGPLGFAGAALILAGLFAVQRARQPQ